MMRKLLCLFLLLQTVVLQAAVSDDNYLHLADVTIKQGETIEVQMLMTNANTVSAVQGKLILPAGLSIVKKSNGRIDAQNIDARSEDFTLSCNVLDDGSLTFAQYSADGYTYEGNTGGIFTFKIKADETATAGTYTVTLSNVVLSVDGVGYDIPDRTSSLTVTQAVIPQITADDKSREYGDENPEFTYTASAELNGVPQLTTTATKKSPVGTYDIVVGRGTLQGEYTATDGKLTVMKAPLTISVGNYTITQGDPLPTFTVTYSGFKNGETKAVLTKQPTVVTSATSSSTPGTYDIIVDGAEAKNYDISYVKGRLTINAAVPVTLTANNLTMVYGDEVPELTFTAEGGELKGTPVLSCSATSSSPVGTYTITIKKGTVSNASVTYVNGKLTITKAPLTIKAGTYRKIEGESNPEITLEYEGFKNGETADVLTTQPTVKVVNKSTAIDDIVISGAQAKNYEISYVNGKLITIVDTEQRRKEINNVRNTAINFLHNTNADDRPMTFQNCLYPYLNSLYSIIIEKMNSGEEQVVEYETAIMDDDFDPEPYERLYYNDYFDKYWDDDLIKKLTKRDSIVTQISCNEGGSVIACIWGKDYEIRNENMDLFWFLYDAADIKEMNSLMWCTEPEFRLYHYYPYCFPDDVQIPVSIVPDEGYCIESITENGQLVDSIEDLSGARIVKKLSVVFKRDESSGFSNVNMNDNDNSRWYSLDGQLLQGKPTQKGVYIHNGKKVVM